MNGLRALVTPRRPLLRAWLRGPVRDTAWITLGALLGAAAAVAAVPLLVGWVR